MFWQTWVLTAPGRPDPGQLNLASWWVQTMGAAYSQRRQAWLPLSRTYWHQEWAWPNVDYGSFPRETQALLMTHEFTCENEPHVPGFQYIVWVQSSLVQPLLSMSASEPLWWIPMIFHVRTVLGESQEQYYGLACKWLVFLNEESKQVIF